MSKAATVLTKKSAEIMKLWEARARKEVASAYGTTSLVLRDALVGHLEQLARALGSPKGESTAAIAKTTVGLRDVGKEHGRDRSQMAGYSIEEVIFEYRILRQTVIQILEKEVKLSGKEREIITDLCEQAVNDAAAEFSDHQRIVSEQFTAVLTHDLRNPMSAAKTSAELVLRRSTQPDCLKYAGRIVDNINRMDTMIQDLLDSGRIRAGEVLAAKMVECHPAEVAAEVISEFTSAHGDRFFLSSDNDLQVWWSPDLIRRAFENLIGNAIKYGDAHSPIHVSLHQNENHSMVRITVHNEGNPIPESELKGLFKIYGRLKSAESSSKKGWGLGLTLVSGVAKSHGGKVSVESLKGKGTSFTMTLPRDCREKENLKEDDKKLPPLQREKTKKIASRIGKRRPGPALQ